MAKIFLATSLITKMLQLLVKKPIYLILFSQNRAQLLNTTVISFLSTNPTTYQCRSKIEFAKDDIKRIICKFDPNKALGDDMINIRMLKMFHDVITEPLFTIFQKVRKLWKISR